MKTWVKIIIGLVIVGIITMVLVYKLVYNKKHPDYEYLEPAYSLTAPDFYQAFKTNKDAASAKYTGKVIALTGSLTKVEMADSLVTAVFVFAQGDFGDEGVRCTFLFKYNDEAGKLQPDGEIKVKGYCTGYNDTDVILDKCSIIHQ
jgi:hypothetical protein